MHGSLFLPPNIHRLSNSAIGVVVARRPTPPSYVVNTISVERGYAPIETTSPVSVSKCGSNLSADVARSQFATPSAENPQSARDQQSDLEWDEPCDKQRNELWDNLSIAERVLMLQRRRRRLTQRRYRKKKEDKASSLAKEVDLLREGVRELKKKIIASPPPEEAKTPWSLVVRYFSLFRFGFNVHELGDVTSSSLVEVHVQKKFLLETMASDVASNGGIGLQSMLYEWRNLSLRHTNLEIALVKLDRHSNGVIIADIKLYTTITASMLRNAFADSDAADGEYNRPEFAWKLLGQRLVFLGGVRFEWDETKCQFASVLYEVDMLSPLLKFLADVEEAALVMDSALGILPMKVDTD